MGYWEDLPIESYPDDFKMPNGLTPRHYARLQQYQKLLRIGRLIKQAKLEGINVSSLANRLEEVAGHWYLGVRCRDCRRVFSFSKEEELAKRFSFTNVAEIVLDCPRCRMKLPYSGHSIIRILKP